MLLYEDHRSIVYALAFSADGSTLFSGAKDGSAIIRDADGEPVVIRPSGSPVYTAAFHPTRPELAVGTSSDLMLYDRRPHGGWGQSRPIDMKPVVDFAYLDANTLAVGVGTRGIDERGRFELWDLATWRVVEPTFPEPHGVRAVAVAPRKKVVAWAAGRRTVNVWETTKPDVVRFPQTAECSALALSRDGELLAVATDWTVRLFEREKRRERAVLKGHKGHVAAVAFSPDGSTVVTGGWDQTVRSWDAVTGRERDVWTWPIGRVYRLAFAPDGARLAAGGEAGGVIVWDVE